MPVSTESSVYSSLGNRSGASNWQANVALVAGILLGLVYLVSGLWKLVNFWSKRKCRLALASQAQLRLASWKPMRLSCCSRRSIGAGVVYSAPR